MAGRFGQARNRQPEVNVLNRRPSPRRVLAAFRSRNAVWYSWEVWEEAALANLREFAEELENRVDDLDEFLRENGDERDLDEVGRIGDRLEKLQKFLRDTLYEFERSIPKIPSDVRYSPDET